jgi:PPK2 family polyphosphate:nucleotide phosphotransferase
MVLSPRLASPGKHQKRGFPRFHLAAPRDQPRTPQMAVNMRRILDRHRVTNGNDFRLKRHDPADTGGRLVTQSAAQDMVAQDVQRLSSLHDRLYARNEWALLCVFQAMDAGGKDSAIKHVMTGVNPQGVQVTSFKAPGPEELAHDFLWRINRALPERGTIGIFNRSHYEEVLAVRVHPEFLARQHLPQELQGKKLWDQRLQAIVDFERYLTRQGLVVLKFFLNVSKEEQKRRFLDRLEQREKHWKFSPSDMAERAHWDDYQTAYQAAIAATATPHAPWFVVPADHKWYTRLIVVAAMVEALEALDLKLPEPTSEQQLALDAARKKLESEPG